MQQPRPTFSESWYRVAALKARLRGSAQISRQHYRGDRWYVVRDPAGNQFHRLSAGAYRFVGLLDGTRTVADAWDLVGGQLADDAPTQNEVIQILTQLHAANLLEADITPDAAVLLRRHKRMVKKQWQGRMMNLLFPRIPLWDPDRFLCRWMPVVRPLLSWVGMIVWLGVIVAAIAMLVPRWTELKGAASAATDPQNWPFLWAAFVGIKLIHELGHAFACRRFGGECHELGVMFLIFVPTPYVDASSAWSFPNKWARMFVGMAGMWVELFVAAIMAFIWASTAANYKLVGIPVHDLAYNVMLVASVSTILFNANPLLRYDGYYILSDWLEIPNLRHKSTEYALGLIKRHVFRVKSPLPLPPIGQRVWLFLYAVLSGIYRVFVGIMIILIVTDKVPVLGVLMALGGVVTWLFVPVFKTLNYLLLNPELHRKRIPATAWTVAFVAAVVWFVGFVPFTPHFQAEGIVEPVQREVLHARLGGVVEQVAARDGQWIEAGSPILVAHDAQLDAGIRSLKAKVEQLQAQLDWARVNDQSQVRSTLAQIAPVREQLQDSLEKQADLTIRAPFAGHLIAPRLHEMEGKYLQRGEEVATIATLDRLQVKAALPQEDAQLVFLQRDDTERPEVWPSGERSFGKLLPRKSETLVSGRIADRLPTAQEELPHAALGFSGGGQLATDPRDPRGVRAVLPPYVVWVDVDEARAGLIPGQRAYVRFFLDKKPLIWQWERRFLQLIQQHSNTKWL